MPRILEKMECCWTLRPVSWQVCIREARLSVAPAIFSEPKPEPKMVRGKLAAWQHQLSHMELLFILQKARIISGGFWNVLNILGFSWFLPFCFGIWGAERAVSVTWPNILVCPDLLSQKKHTIVWLFGRILIQSFTRLPHDDTLLEAGVEVYAKH